LASALKRIFATAFAGRSTGTGSSARGYDCWCGSVARACSIAADDDYPIGQAVNVPTSRDTNNISPLVSIVTPSFNMGAYIEETIASVLAQDYPNLEYIVMDAGSTDGTLNVLKKYEGRLQYVSQPDDGTADALNKGFAKSRGSMLAFLNADDTYQPGAISAAVGALSANPKVAMVYGEGVWVDERGEIIGHYPTGSFDRQRLERECFICQPAAFFRREPFEAIGGMDPKLHYTFDYDLWIRMARQFELRKIDKLLAASRLHPASKTVGSPKPMVDENIGLLRRHFGYVPLAWVCRYISMRIGEKIAIPPPTTLSLRAYCVSLPAGLAMNPRYPLRYLREWMGVWLHNRFWGQVTQKI
jgi:hypothetical protein